MDEMLEEHQIGENGNNTKVPLSDETNQKTSVFDRLKLSNLNLAQKIADAVIIGFFVIFCVRDAEFILMVVPLMVPILFAINKWMRPKNAVYFGLLLFVLMMFIDDINAGIGSMVDYSAGIAPVRNFVPHRASAL